MKKMTETLKVYLFLLLVFIVFAAIIYVRAGESEAQTAVYTRAYNNQEKIYLKNITPILYELSEIGKTVSQKAVSLQNSSPDVCSHEFGYYQGIVESLRVRLNSFTPPPRMVNVQTTALLAIGDYISGLNLYTKACTEDDYSMKSKMGYDGRQRIIEADAKIRQVNDLITNPWGHTQSRTESRAQAQTQATNNKIAQMCASTWPADPRMQDYCVKNQTEALVKLNQMSRKYAPGSRERQTIQNCSTLWKKGNAYDYRMIVFCVENVLGKQATQ